MELPTYGCASAVDLCRSNGVLGFLLFGFHCLSQAKQDREPLPRHAPVTTADAQRSHQELGLDEQRKQRWFET